MSSNTVEAQPLPEEDVKAPSDGDLTDTEYVIEAHLDPERRASTPGIYLDDEQRRAAEVTRARIEGREPDLENPPSYAGDVVKPLAEALKTRAGDQVVDVKPYMTLPTDNRVFNDQDQLVVDGDGDEVYQDGDEIVKKDENGEPTSQPTNEELATAQTEHKEDGSQPVGSPDVDESNPKQSDAELSEDDKKTEQVKFS